MEESLVWTNQDLAEYLKCDIRTARAWCFSNGIIPVDIGKGSRKYLRWNSNEVKSATCTRRVHSNVPSSSSAKPKQTPKKRLFDSSIKELMAAHAAQAAA